MDKQEIRRKAYENIEKRRAAAQSAALEREREVTGKYPEIAEYRSEMARTASELTSAIIRRSKDTSAAVESIKNTNQAAAKAIADTLRAAGLPEDYLSIKYYCPVCHDKGYTADGGLCDCLRREISRIAVDELNRSANIPFADFEHFNVSLHEGEVFKGVNVCKIIQKAYDTAREYAENFTVNSPSLLMIGNSGLGKTHLSMAIAREVTIKGYSVVYGSAINQLRSLDQEFFRDKKSDTLDVLLNCDLLIMDDLGSEYNLPSSEANLYNLINSRINSGRPMIISTNLDQTSLQDKYDQRICSRLMFNFRQVVFFGQDARKKLGSRDNG